MTHCGSKLFTSHSRIGYALYSLANRGRVMPAHTTDETIQAIREFVNAKDWDATQQIVEAHKDILFKLETETALEALIAQAEAAHDERVEKP